MMGAIPCIRPNSQPRRRLDFLLPPFPRIKTRKGGRERGGFAPVCTRLLIKRPLQGRLEGVCDTPLPRYTHSFPIMHRIPPVFSPLIPRSRSGENDFRTYSRDTRLLPFSFRPVSRDSFFSQNRIRLDGVQSDIILNCFESNCMPFDKNQNRIMSDSMQSDRLPNCF